jgi:hypothetical protein
VTVDEESFSGVLVVELAQWVFVPVTHRNQQTSSPPQSLS